MSDPDPTSLLAIHASAVVDRLVADPRIAASIVATVTEGYPGVDPRAALPFLVSDAVSAALEAAGDPDDRHQAALRDWLLHRPTAARVAGALRALCGYTPDQVADLTRRRPDEVARLLIGVPMTGAEIGPQGSAPPEDRGEDHPRRVTLGTLSVALFAVLMLVVITHDGGERPQLAEAAPTVLGSEPCRTASQPASTISTRTVTVGLDQRAYRLSVPPGIAGNSPLPLLVDLSDAGESADVRAAASGIEGTGRAHSFAVLTPNPGGVPPAWNLDTGGSAEDVQFVTAAVGDASSTICVDPRRVWVVGGGRGADLAGVLACERSDLFVAMVAVEPAEAPLPCQAVSRPVSVLVVASEAVDPASDPAASWARTNDCGTEPVRTVDTPPDGRSVDQYQACRGGSTVQRRSGPGPGAGPATWPAGTSDLAYGFLATRARD